MRSATSATECASTGSVLRPLPVENTRARADSFAGTSTTGSPTATSRCATWRPMPEQPSTAHSRSGCRRPAANRSRNPFRSVPNRPSVSTFSCRSMTWIVTDLLCGSIPMITRDITALPNLDPIDDRRGGQRYFE